MLINISTYLIVVIYPLLCQNFVIIISGKRYALTSSHQASLLILLQLTLFHLLLFLYAHKCLQIIEKYRSININNSMTYRRSPSFSIKHILSYIKIAFKICSKAFKKSKCFKSFRNCSGLYWFSFNASISWVSKESR